MHQDKLLFIHITLKRTILGMIFKGVNKLGLYTED